MVAFDRVFAVSCACCKADGANVPEVEAVVRLLFPAIGVAYARVLDSITDRAVHLLSADTEDLLAAYLTASKRLTWRPLSPELVRLVEQSAGQLFNAAAGNAGVPVPASLAGSATMAAEQLQLLIEDLIERGVVQSLPTAAGLAQAGLTGAGSSEAVVAFRAQLREALDVEQALRPLVDAWSYQTYNAGSVRAAAASGHNFMQLWAKLDGVTTAFCRLVHGRVIPMARALEQLDRIAAAVAAGDAAALFQAAPFFPRPSQATPQDVEAALARGGLAPFHHGCRTQNVPIRLPAS